MSVQRSRFFCEGNALANTLRCLRQRIGETLSSCRGQSTVEYAVVLFGFLALVIASGAIWDFLHDGMLVEHALQSASHHVTLVNPGALRDVFLY